MISIWKRKEVFKVDFQISGEEYNFLIEIFQSNETTDNYKIGMSRLEFLRVHPTFGPYPDGGADHGIYVKDYLLDGLEMTSESSSSVLDFCLKRLEEQGFK